MKVQAVICKKCGDTIFSRSRHDFRSCSCNRTSIDGGRDYTKVSFDEKFGYEQIELDIDVESKDLYSDYAHCRDEYGLIKGKRNNENI